MDANSLYSQYHKTKKVWLFFNVISLNQLLQHFKHASEVYLTLRNHVKIFLSLNISDNVWNVVYLKNLSIKYIGLKTVQTQISSLIKVYTINHFGHPIASKVHTVHFLRQFL